MQCLLKLLVSSLVAAALPLAAVQDTPEKLDCIANSFPPYLDFEFRFVTGTWFQLPIKQFWGERVVLNLQVVIEPVNGTPGRPVRLRNSLKAREAVPDGVKGRMYFSSAYSIGPGQYHATWRIRDQNERSCQGSRRFKAALSRRDQAVDVTLAPGEIEDATVYLLRPEERIDRPHLQWPTRLKIFLSMDVLGRRGRAVKTRPLHVLPHFSALRQLARSPNFNQYSLVCFSFEDQTVLLRQDYDATINFTPLGEVIRRLQPDTVDIRQLGRGREMDFFEQMLAEELLRNEAPQAVVFVGQEMHFGKRLPERLLGRFRQLGAPFAFLDASRYVWRGAIGNFVRAMQGREYMLRRPSDLARAMQSFEDQVALSRAQ